MMEIYLLRHGIAQARRPGRADAERQLTGEGKDKLRRVLEMARVAGVRPPLILTSPYIRAVETAEIAAEILGSRDPIVRTDALLPAASPRAVWELIRSYADEAAILLSGHEPLLGETACYLVGASRTLVDLKKGALLRIDVEETGPEPLGMIQWLLTAKLAAAGATPAGG